jgi:hypothetical protein
VLESPWHLPPKGGDSPCPLQKDAAIYYHASPTRSKRRPLPGFEQKITFGMKLETKKFFRIQK